MKRINLRQTRTILPLLSAFSIFLFVFSCTLSAGDNVPVSDGLKGSHTVPLTVDQTVDPAYTGLTYQSRFVPPDGKFLVIAGQDKLNIAQIPADCGYSAGGYAHYFAVSESNGIWSDKVNGGDPHDTQNAKWIADTHPDSVLQMAMWMVGKDMGWDDYPYLATNGNYNAAFQSFCDFAKAYNRPIFLRIGYEFDGPHNKLSPGPYVNAYRYIVDFIRITNHVTNVAFVWHSWNNYTYNSYPIMDWYPGDGYVDWFGMSVFLDHVRDGNISPYLDSFVDLAKAHQKPVMIAESCPSPDGGIKNNNYESWNRWFVPYLNYIHKKNIKAFSYINCNWDLTLQFGTWNWGNTRLQDYPLILTQWNKEITNDRYLKESAGLFKILGFTN